MAAKCHSSAPASQLPSAIWRRECEAEQRRGIVDLPARADHHQHGQRVDPVRHAHPDRMDERRAGVGHHRHIRCRFAAHDICPAIEIAITTCRRRRVSHSCHGRSRATTRRREPLAPPSPRVRGEGRGGGGLAAILSVSARTADLHITPRISVRRQRPLPHPSPRAAGRGSKDTAPNAPSHRQQHGVDDMDHAVRLQHVGDRDHGDVALGVGDESLPGPACLTISQSPATVLSLASPSPSLTAFIRLTAVMRPGTT